MGNLGASLRPQIFSHAPQGSYKCFVQAETANLLCAKLGEKSRVPYVVLRAQGMLCYVWISPRMWIQPMPASHFLKTMQAFLPLSSTSNITKLSQEFCDTAENSLTLTSEKMMTDAWASHPTPPRTEIPLILLQLHTGFLFRSDLLAQSPYGVLRSDLLADYLLIYLMCVQSYSISMSNRKKCANFSSFFFLLQPQCSIRRQSQEHFKSP